MSDVSKFNEDNLAGIQLFDFVPVADVMATPNINKTTYIAAGFVVLKSQKSWTRLYSTLGTIKYGEKKKETPNGAIYEQAMEFNVPKDREEISALFSGMEEHRFIIKYKDLNGKVKLLGTVENPFRFTNDLNTNSNPSQLNGYNCAFVCESKEKAPFYINETGIGSFRIGSTFKIN